MTTLNLILSHIMLQGTIHDDSLPNITPREGHRSQVIMTANLILSHRESQVTSLDECQPNNI